MRIGGAQVQSEAASPTVGVPADILSHYRPPPRLSKIYLRAV